VFGENFPLWRGFFVPCIGPNRQTRFDRSSERGPSAARLRPTAHPGMQAEAVRLCAQRRHGFLVPAGHRAVMKV